MNTKLHAITDQGGRPLSFFMTAGQISDHTGAATLLDSLPAAQWMPGDRGYDADWFWGALEAKGMKPCIPGQKSRGKPVRYDKGKYKKLLEQSAHDSTLKLKEVFGEAFCKSFERMPPF